MKTLLYFVLGGSLAFWLYTFRLSLQTYIKFPEEVSNLPTLVFALVQVVAWGIASYAAGKQFNLKK